MTKVESRVIPHPQNLAYMGGKSSVAPLGREQCPVCVIKLQNRQGY